MASFIAAVAMQQLADMEGLRRDLGAKAARPPDGERPRGGPGGPLSG